MNHLLEARGYARKIVEDSRDEETLDRAQCIVQRLTPTIIRLAELGQIENFVLSDEERASVVKRPPIPTGPNMGEDF
jgi:hypothetical protein